MAKLKTKELSAEDLAVTPGPNGKVRVVAKTAMWRGGLRWEAGLNEVEPETMTPEIVKALKGDQGDNFTIL